MKSVYILFLAICAINANAFKVERCPEFNGQGIIDIEKISISPDPVVAGGKVTTSIKGVLREPIDKTIKVSGHMRFSIIKVPIPKKSICAFLDECPLDEGPVDVQKTEKIDDDIPSGHYTGHVELRRGDEYLDCFDMEIDVE